MSLMVAVFKIEGELKACKKKDADDKYSIVFSAIDPGIRIIYCDSGIVDMELLGVSQGWNYTAAVCKACELTAVEPVYIGEWSEELDKKYTASEGYVSRGLVFKELEVE